MSAIEYATRDAVAKLGDIDHEISSKDGKRPSKKEKNGTSTEDQDKVTAGFEIEMAKLAEESDFKVSNKGFVMGHYTSVNIDKYNILVLAGSLVDVKFLIKIPNFWARSDWRELVETAVRLAFVPLKENISRGVMVASRVSLMRNAPESVAITESLLRNTV